MDAWEEAQWDDEEYFGEKNKLLKGGKGSHELRPATDLASAKMWPGEDEPASSGDVGSGKKIGWKRMEKELAKTTGGRGDKALGSKPFYERPRFYLSIVGWCMFCGLICVLIFVAIFLVILFLVILPNSVSGSSRHSTSDDWCWAGPKCFDASNAYSILVVVERGSHRPVKGAVLETVNHIKYVTDSAGGVYFWEPGMEDRDVYFYISAENFTYPADGFGYRGTALKIQSGSVHCLEVDPKSSTAFSRDYFISYSAPPSVRAVECPPCLPKKEQYAQISVTDSKTAVSVPLARVRLYESNTKAQLLYEDYTDSNGVIAFFSPALMEGDTYFVTVDSHGFTEASYSSSFKPGSSLFFGISAVNIAVRLYRTTGQGIYRHSTLLGLPTPLQNPNLNSFVMGQDSTVTTMYRGQLHWFWGDTLKLSYPLGNFYTTSSVTPPSGLLNWKSGMDYAYFQASDGFTKPMITPPTGESGPTWTDGVATLRTSEVDSTPKLVAFWSLQRNDKPGATYDGQMVWSDATSKFEIISQVPSNNTALFPLNRGGGARSAFFGVDSVSGVSYLYYGWPFPVIRVRPFYAYWKDPTNYEFFTCLVPGGRLNEPEVDRSGGTVVWGWKPNTAAVNSIIQARLVKSGLLQPSEVWMQYKDVDSGDLLASNAGTLVFNEHTGKYVTLFHQVNGSSSLLGEVWFGLSENFDDKVWNMRKVVTHSHYGFYNVFQHNVFANLTVCEGRESCASTGFGATKDEVIFFEGTFSNTWDSSAPVPRYDYNPVMYSLNLSDPLLHRPPLYRGKQIAEI